MHQMDNVPPEVSLMASCIIVLKMVYGLDGVERQVTLLAMNGPVLK